MEKPFKDFEDRLDLLYCTLPGTARREVLLSRLYFHVFKLLDERFNASLSEYGLTRTTFSALLLLYSDPDNAVSPSALSQVMVSSRTNITRVADELEAGGWLERRPHPEDRRRVCLSLTPSGQALLERVLPRQRLYMKDLWSGLSESEQVQFESLLRKLHSQLISESADHGEAS